MNKNNELEENKNEISSVACPMTSVMNVIGGKWKVIILFHLRDQTLRFGELKKRIPKITQKMLTQQLRELELDGLVSRKVYPEVPPKVEYKSMPLSDELRPILDMLCDWGQKQQALK
ncbi:HxlR family transcriptional regulator [Marinomonas sp. S3726]|uniref:winged helix-turn-helix transcriptional regulator n=1 Tax=Marinomonas sp. S3726 TaxID=579484 RepID=UPI0005FA33EC|nr:helix-turn-helix domain-containing protein [Marinomonas sp. S3726]KJZ11238.1 HxlR family transcriptional regulator [Marinomonas sp. S3726]